MAEPAHTIIYEAVHGSRAFGLDTPASDVDLKGIIVGPRAWYHGFEKSPEQIEISAECVLFEVRKFFVLAAAANPTAVELLWVEPQHHRIVTPAARLLLDRRAEFLSRRVGQTFSGYAMSQLRRIRGHRGWLLHPPAAKPMRGAFGLPETTLVSRDQLGAAERLIATGSVREAELTPNFLDLMNRERRYRGAKKGWDQYQVWLASRNPERAALEARFGYDTKHAQHLVRLLRMGIEILGTGSVEVLRRDRAELLAIRDGAWSYDALIEYVESLHDEVRDAIQRSPLPETPDESQLNALCAEIVERTLEHAPA